MSVSAQTIVGAELRVAFSNIAGQRCRPDLPAPNDGLVVLSLAVPVATNGRFLVTLSEPELGRTIEIAGKFKSKRKLKGAAVVIWNDCSTLPFTWRARWQRPAS